MAGPTPLPICSGFCSLFTLVLAIILLALASLGSISMSVLEEEQAELGSARDTMCTLSSLPGTPSAQRTSHSCGKNCKKDVMKVECIASVHFDGGPFRSNMSAGVAVLAGLDFTLSRDAAQWCASTLAGTWPNARFLNGGRTRLVNWGSAELPVSAEWQCGDTGWVGCKSVSTGFLSSDRQCTHSFGPSPDLSNMQGFNTVMSPAQLPACLAARDGAQVRCSVDAGGQLRLGSTRELLQSVRKDMEDVEAAKGGLQTAAFVLLGISLLLFLTFLWLMGVLTAVAQLARRLGASLGGGGGGWPGAAAARGATPWGGAVIGAPSGLEPGNGKACPGCDGSGQRGLLGPRGLGVFKRPCAACGGRGTRV